MSDPMTATEPQVATDASVPMPKTIGRFTILNEIGRGSYGVVWAAHDPQRNVFTMHVLDLYDEAAWRRTVKERYEQPLMEIFE